jgi:hypothetical protein
MSEAPKQRINQADYDLIVRLGRRLKYTWRRLDDETYQTVRPDGSVCITFGPVHQDDREYFDKLCEEKS